MRARRERLAEALGALESSSPPTIWRAIEAAVPAGAAAGERYDAQQMAILDSERTRAGGMADAR